MSSDRRTPVWLLPNLLSLDAPLVAVAWLHVFARTLRADYLPAIAYVVLALSVWAIYVFDRLLDAGLRGGDESRLEPRHRMHLRYKELLGGLGALAAVLAVLLALVGMPMEILRYALVGGLLVLGFFALAFFGDTSSREVAYGKNAIAGLTFSFGTAAAAFVYLPMLGMFDLLVSKEMICFGVLCMLNITAIDLWEHSARASDPEQKAAYELSLTLPLVLLGASTLAFAVMDHEASTRPFYYSVLTGAALLFILNRNRTRFSADALRVLADVALLVPVIVFEVLWLAF